MSSQVIPQMKVSNIQKLMLPLDYDQSVHIMY